VRRTAVLVAVLAAGLAGACGADRAGAPACDDARRLAIVAQSVPDAAYLPCVGDLPPGWDVRRFEVTDRGTSISLGSDRADRPIEVELSASCELDGATATTPRDEGVRTYLLVDDLRPRYEGRLLDVFPGGCITYEFAFERGPHVALMDELQRAVGLRARRDVRQALDADLHVNLDP
jgi:hypothetical protein